MNIIVTAIATLTAWIVALNNEKIASKNHRLIRSLSIAIGIFTSLLLAYQVIFRFLVIIPAGTVGVVETFGRVSQGILNSGVNFVSPFSKVVKYSTRLKDIKETIASTSSEGLNLNLDVSLQYRLEPERAVSVYSNIGLSEEEILISRFRSIVREITATYEAKSIYGDKRQEIAQKLHEELSKELAPIGFIVEESLLRNVELPEKIKASIEQKITAAQESERQQFVIQKQRQELEFELEKAQKEAERKKIEARGVAEAQKLISQGLTDKILELKAIEATQQLATSDNSKIIVVGRSQDGLPIILQNP
jgi:regulator of protease activity HflC (stomatin/prohibitin superfamily)